MHPVTTACTRRWLCLKRGTRNALRSRSGADKYAPEIMQKAETELNNAVAIQDGKHRDVKMEFTYARGATQNFEDARITTLRKQAEERRHNN